MNQLYVECALISVLGAGLKIWIKFAAMRSKAFQANVKFNWGENVRLDWPAWITSLFVIVICMFLIETALDWKTWMVLAIRPLFVCVGYMGTDLFIYAMGAANKMINRVIDLKTTIADKQTGTLTTPTQLPTRGDSVTL